MLKIQLLRKHNECRHGLELQEQLLVGFKVDGHADFADYGQDIVCAGASALAQGALIGLHDALGNEVSFVKRPGYLEVKVNPEKACEIAPQAILRTLELGLLSIARAYRGYVEVAYQDVI